MSVKPSDVVPVGTIADKEKTRVVIFENGRMMHAPFPADAEVTWGDITGIPVTFPPSAHEHTQLVSGTQTATLNGLGSFTITSAPSNSNLLTLANPGSGFYSGITGTSGGVRRWLMYLGNNVAETGGDAGSDFGLYRYSDSAVAASVMSIVRATGGVTFAGSVTAGSFTTAGTVTATGNMTANAFYSDSAYFIGTQTIAVLGTATGGSGSIALRPTAYNSTTNQTTISAAGSMTVYGTITSTIGSVVADTYVYANAGSHIGSSTVAILGLASGGAGSVYLRPRGYNDGVNQTLVDTNGDMVINGNATSATGHFISTPGIFRGGTQAVLGCDTAGFIKLRPTNWNSTTGETKIAATTGNMDVTGTITCGSATSAQVVCGSVPSTTGANLGIYMVIGGTGSSIRSSATGTGTIPHAIYYNPNGTVGSINTSASATAFSTSSDENLKDFTGPYSGEEAIAVIRADPVRSFTWKADGTPGVGWGAQTSYAIRPDLASPPPDPDEGEEPKAPGEPGYMPWSIDYGKRTPFLWAALSAALDRIDALEARIEALEK